MVEDSNTKDPQKDRIIAIVGPTATGKTSRAVSVAKYLDGEIISADSRQVYKRMDLGTGKDLDEYREIKYHLIDICEAGEKYNLHKYIKDFRSALTKIRDKDKRVVLCGGTGMYIETALSGVVLPEVPVNHELRKRLESKSLEELTEILKGYKTLHNTTDVDTVKRAVRAIEIEEFYKYNPLLAENAYRKKAKPLDAVIVGIDIPLELRRKRISLRLRNRLEAGMVKEVEDLLKGGVSAEDLIYYGLEYKYLTLYVIGQKTYEEMVRELEIAIHQFAKRQMTWFRGMERRGFKINWLPYDMPESEFIEKVKSFL